MISFQHHAQLSVEVSDVDSDVDSYYSDLPTLPTTPHGNDQTRQLGIPQDPRLWESIEVLAWLDWAVSEFQLFSDTVATYNRDFQVSHWEINIHLTSDFIHYILVDWQRHVRYQLPEAALPALPLL